MDGIIQELSIQGMDFSVSLYSLVGSMLLGLCTYLVAGLTFNRSMLIPTNLVVALTLPPIALTITGSIASNFALSLGMIGALSIVRYRTPIKSPYELTLLFLLVTIGVVSGVNIVNAVYLLIVFTLSSFILKIIMSQLRPATNNTSSNFELILTASKSLKELPFLTKYNNNIVSVSSENENNTGSNTVVTFEFESLTLALQASEEMHSDGVTVDIEWVR